MQPATYTYQRGLKVRIMNLNSPASNRIAVLRRRQAAQLKEVLSALMTSPIYFCCPVQQRVEILLKHFA